MDDATPTELVIVPDPTVKLMPFALVLMALIWGGMATFVPDIPLVLRVAAWAAMVAVVSFVYLTTVRRLAFDDEGVDIERTTTRLRIPYTDLDHVTIRAQPLAGTLSVTFVTDAPRSVIRTRTGLTSNEVLRVAPQLVRTLVVHGVAVNVPGRPDLSTR